MASCDEGRLFLARTRRGVTLGVAREVTPGRLVAWTSEGGREQWLGSQVLYASEILVTTVGDGGGATSGRVGARAFLSALLPQVAEARSQLDTVSLWASLVDDPSTRGVHELAMLLSPSSGPVERLATAWALAEDEVHFRESEPGRYVPNPRDDVEKTLRRRRQGEQEQQVVARALAELEGALVRGSADGMEAREAVEWLSTLAIHGRDDREAVRGLALLDLRNGGPPADPEGHAFRLLVRLGVFQADEILGLHRLRIPRSFPLEVLEEAERIASGPILDGEGYRREELRWPAGGPGPIAVDDASTRDVDDALMVEIRGSNSRVHILISDPTAWIPLGSTVFLEGQSRASSIYLPDGRIPMLPPVLSEGLLSLAPGKRQPMLDFACTLGAGGEVLDFEVLPVWATLDRRLSYDEVDAMVAGPPLEPDATADAMRRLVGLARLLRSRRIDEGASFLERDEIIISIMDGQPVVRRASAESAGRQMVHEFMVLACSLAGRLARDNGIPLVYRRQSPPDDRPIVGLRPGSRAWAWKWVRRQRRAELSPYPDFHSGVGVRGYTQVTSPLRRFQDLLSHYQIKGFLRDGRAPLGIDEVVRTFGDLESNVEKRNQVQREARRYWLFKALARRVGEEVGGEIVAIQGKHAVVNLDDLGLELPVPGLAAWAPGSAVRLFVREVDPRRDRAILVPT